jgi:hypothetical protein
VIIALSIAGGLLGLCFVFAMAHALYWRNVAWNYEQRNKQLAEKNAVRRIEVTDDDNAFADIALRVEQLERWRNDIA